MQDFGEEVLAGMRFHDGRPALTMHNRYLVLYAQGHPRGDPSATSATTRAATSGSSPAPATRAGRARPPTRARNFPGDETTDWTRSSGLASSTPDMLNRAIGGAYGFSTDIGGYFDLTTPPTTKELFIRWAEWAALTPVFRLHGAGPTGTHTPWSFDDADGQGLQPPLAAPPARPRR